MYEVRIYDDAGKLKKIISEKALSERSDKLIHFPSSYAKSGKKTKVIPPTPTDKSELKTKANRAL